MKHMWIIRNKVRTSLVVQWLRLCSQCRGHRFDPWLEKTVHATWRKKKKNEVGSAGEEEAREAFIYSPFMTETSC